MADPQGLYKGVLILINSLMNIVESLKKLGYDLPAVAAPAANYVPYAISGKHIFISGQIPFLNGQKMHVGKVGDSLTLEQGIEAAKACALNILAQADAAVGGDWGKIKRLVKLGGFVNCVPDFVDHPKVVNGASDLIVGVLGDMGKHTRFAVGAPSLPLGVAVEIEALFELN